MKGLRYKTKSGLKEMALYIENYNKENIYLFINDNNFFIMKNVEKAKEYIKKNIKGVKCEDISFTADSPVVFDMLDAIIFAEKDYDVLRERYITTIE